MNKFKISHLNFLDAEAAAEVEAFIAEADRSFRPVREKYFES